MAILLSRRSSVETIAEWCNLMETEKLTKVPLTLTRQIGYQDEGEEEEDEGQHLVVTLKIFI